MIKINKAKSLLIVASVLTLTFVVRGSSAAGSATLSLSPSSGTKVKNTSFTVSIYENSGSEPVSSVGANLTYDSAKLQFLSVDTTSGAFPNCINVNGGAGKVTIPCVKFGGSNTNKQLVAKVSFKVLSSSGSSAINFASDAEILSYNDDSNVWNGSRDGGVYTLSSGTTSGGGSSSGGSSSGGSGSSGSSSGGSSSGGSRSKTSSGTKSTSSGSSKTKTSTSKSSNNSETPIPEGSDSVPSIVANGNVEVFVTDANGTAVEGAKVFIDDKTSLTGKDGIAAFAGIAPGTYKVKVESKNGVAGASIVVDGTNNAEAQRVNVKLKRKINYLLILGIAAILVLAGVLINLLRKLQQKKQEHSRHFNHANAVVASDMSKPAVVDDSMATVVKPRSEDEEEKPSGKESVKPTDTLEEIERKVGAKKGSHAPEKSETKSSNDFDPSLTDTKKD